jgi:hypothetical protein
MKIRFKHAGIVSTHTLRKVYSSKPKMTDITTKKFMNKIFHATNEKLQRAPGSLIIKKFANVCFQFVKKQSFIHRLKTQKIGNCNHKKDQLKI